MELSYAIARYEQALELLPVRWQQAARRLPDWRKAQAEEFRLRTGVRRLMEFFAQHDLDAQLAVRVYRMYGEGATDLLYDDPYLLMEDGLDASFGAVDRFAISLGVAGDDHRRVEAGILFELRYNLTAGHSFLPKEKLAAAQKESAAKLEKMQFDHILEGKLSERKPRNAVAVKALLNMDGLKLSNGEIVGLTEQLDKIAKENDFLFESSEPVPKYMGPTGGGSGGQADDSAARAVMGLPPLTK